MIQPSRHLLTRLLCSGGIVVAAALLAFGSGRSAHASCGDWLVGHDMPGVSQGPTTPASGGDAAPAPPPARRPCNGPSCGRAPVAPLAPSEAPSSAPDVDRAALLSHVAPVEASAAGAWLAFDEPLLIAALSGRLERPPRVA